MKHVLVKYEYQASNLPQYRHYAECNCGFQSRLGTEAAVKSQFDAHMRAHGEEAHFANLSVNKEAEPEEVVLAGMGKAEQQGQAQSKNVPSDELLLDYIKQKGYTPEGAEELLKTHKEEILQNYNDEQSAKSNTV